jgi:hypothetical protein
MMNTALALSLCFCFRESRRLEQIRGFRRAQVCARAEKRYSGSKILEEVEMRIGRRDAIISGFSMVSSWLALDYTAEAMAVKQGLLAGRIPGLSDPDERG